MAHGEMTTCNYLVEMCHFHPHREQAEPGRMVGCVAPPLPAHLLVWCFGEKDTT